METYIIILVIAVVAVGGYYLMTKKKQGATQEENFSAEPEPESEVRPEEKQNTENDM